MQVKLFRLTVNSGNRSTPEGGGEGGMPEREVAHGERRGLRSRGHTRANLKAADEDKQQEEGAGRRKGTRQMSPAR